MDKPLSSQPCWHICAVGPQARQSQCPCSVTFHPAALAWQGLEAAQHLVSAFQHAACIASGGSNSQSLAPAFTKDSMPQLLKRLVGPLPRLLVGEFGLATVEELQQKHEEAAQKALEKLHLSTTDKWKPILPVRVVEGLQLFDAENDEAMLKKSVQVYLDIDGCSASRPVTARLARYQRIYNSGFVYHLADMQGIFERLKDTCVTPSANSNGVLQLSVTSNGASIARVDRLLGDPQAEAANYKSQAITDIISINVTCQLVDDDPTMMAVVSAADFTPATAEAFERALQNVASPKPDLPASECTQPSWSQKILTLRIPNRVALPALEPYCNDLDSLMQQQLGNGLLLPVWTRLLLDDGQECGPLRLDIAVQKQLKARSGYKFLVHGLNKSLPNCLSFLRFSDANAEKAISKQTQQSNLDS
ncbi:hypothetical protein WJX82_005638 [Trebouxia sp. C0006]